MSQATKIGTVRVRTQSHGKQDISLYSNKRYFPDWDNGDYIAVRIDKNTVGYMYCSSTLHKNTSGGTTAQHIMTFRDRNGKLRYVYQNQPSVTEDTVLRTFTSGGSVTLISADENKYGCRIYGSNSRGYGGGNGKNGTNGDKVQTGNTGKPDYKPIYSYYYGSPGNGGAGGSAGARVYNTMILSPIEGGSYSYAANIEGLYGGGGGGGGGAGYGDALGGYGGAGGSAGGTPHGWYCDILSGVGVTSSLTVARGGIGGGNSGSRGETNDAYDCDGGVGGSAGDGHVGFVGGDGDENRAGYGGIGGSSTAIRNWTISNDSNGYVDNHSYNFNAYDNGRTNAVTNNGGIVVVKFKIAPYSS